MDPGKHLQWICLDCSQAETSLNSAERCTFTDTRRAELWEQCLPHRSRAMWISEFLLVSQTPISSNLVQSNVTLGKVVRTRACETWQSDSPSLMKADCKTHLVPVLNWGSCFHLQTLIQSPAGLLRFPIIPIFKSSHLPSYISPDSIINWFLPACNPNWGLMESQLKRFQSQSVCCE